MEEKETLNIINAPKNNMFVIKNKFCKDFKEAIPVADPHYISPNKVVIFFSNKQPKKAIINVLTKFIDTYTNKFNVTLVQNGYSPMAIAKGEKYDTVAFIFNEVEDLGIYCNLQQPKPTKSDKISLSTKEKNSK